MTDQAPGPKDLEALGCFDTPTICNALELVAPERRAFGFTTENLICTDPSLPPIVAWARTATLRASVASPLAPREQRDHRAAYYDYLGQGPGQGPEPTVAIIQDLDPRPGFGAFWGEVNTTVHKALGCLGAVTNGSIRDLDVLAPGFQLLAGKVGPSHAHVHIVDFGGQVNVFGMAVQHHDLVHADRHGAVVIPAAVVRELPAAVDLLVRREKVILDACGSAEFDIGRLKKAMAESAEIH